MLSECRKLPAAELSCIGMHRMRACLKHPLAASVHQVYGEPYLSTSDVTGPVLENLLLPFLDSSQAAIFTCTSKPQVFF